MRVFSTSPARRQVERSPLEISIWFELPYYIGVAYDADVMIRPFVEAGIPARMRFRSDVLRIDTWNAWSHPIPEGAIISGLGEAWRDPRAAESRFIPRYCSETEIHDVVTSLQTAGAPYIHVARPQTVVEVYFKMIGRLPTHPFDDLLDVTFPLFHAVKPSILPQLSAVIDRYRVSLVPSLRYASPPLSEALVSEAVIEVRTPAGEILQQLDYGFDPYAELKGYFYKAERVGVQARFDSLLEEQDLTPEITISDTYALVRMRRWQEAIVLASSVVDSLLRRAVFMGAPSEHEAEALWRRNRDRIKELFGKVLPDLGYQQLSSVAPTLWQDLLQARTARGYSRAWRIRQRFRGDAPGYGHLASPYSG